MSERGKTQRFFHGTTPDHLKVNHARVLSRIYCLEEKYQVATATNFLAGSGGMPPGKFFKWIYPVMQSSAFWDTILRNGTVVFYFIFLVPCHIVSLDRECLLHVHWPCHIWMIFPIQLLIYCNDNNIFGGGGGGKLGILGDDSTPQIP